VLLNVEDFRGAIRAGEWKLIVQATLPGSIELYNLRNDPSEQDNQAELEPERVRALRQRLIEFVGEMAPSKYLDELAGPHSARQPIYWDENPVRP
jgi:arylsulfatase A-like enzyme